MFDCNNNTGAATSNVRPNFKLGIDGLIGMEFLSANCFHTDKDTIPVGAQNVEILGTNIIIDGKNNSPYAHLTSMNFDGNTATISYTGQVINAKLYYTQQDSAFSRTTQVGQNIVITSTADLNNIQFNLIDGSNPNGIRLNAGNNYF